MEQKLDQSTLDCFASEKIKQKKRKKQAEKNEHFKKRQKLILERGKKYAKDCFNDPITNEIANQWKENILNTKILSEMNEVILLEQMNDISEQKLQLYIFDQLKEIENNNNNNNNNNDDSLLNKTCENEKKENEKDNKDNNVEISIDDYIKLKNIFATFDVCNQWLKVKFNEINWKENKTEYDPIANSVNSIDCIKATVECFKIGCKQMIKYIQYLKK